MKAKKKRSRFRIPGMLLAGIATMVLTQLLFFGWIIAGSRRHVVRPVDAVVVYGGGTARIAAGFPVAGEAAARWLVLVVSEEELRYAVVRPTHRLPPGCSIRAVGGTYTTDQNARAVLPVLKQMGVRSAVLVTSWCHMPRAYFLTRLYSVGSGIEWDYVGAEPNPPGWRKRPEVRSELLRFWGSLGRVVLAVVGINNWPRPAGMPRT